MLVTTPDITALRDADRVAGLLECDGIKDIKIIVNRVRPDLVKGEDMMSALDVQEMLGLPLLGVVPEDAEVSAELRRFVAACLQKEPTRRATVPQLLSHPFLTRRDVEASRGALQEIIVETVV